MKNKLFFALFFLLGACAGRIESQINEILTDKKSDAYEVLKNLDELFSSTKAKRQKEKILDAIIVFTKDKMKSPELLQGALLKKKEFLKDPKSKNKNLLLLAQLSLQNLKDENLALDYLNELSLADLDLKQRENYFQLVILCYMSANNTKQALIEIREFLKRKDLTPAEAFKLKSLQARTLKLNNENDKVAKIYVSLINNYPNLSKKWKIRSQLSLIYEEQKKFSEAINQLQLYKKEAQGGDDLLDFRITELKKRLILQPGARGRLKK